MIAGVEPPKLWTRTSRALELAILVTAAAAGVLTAGTLIQLDEGTARLADPRDAMLTWMLYAFFVGAGLAMVRRIPPATVVRYRRRLTVLLAAALAWTLLGVARPVLGAADGLTGEYFTNPAWNGAPALSVADAEPSTAIMWQRWNGVPPDQFSVRWTGFLTVGRGVGRLAVGPPSLPPVPETPRLAVLLRDPETGTTIERDDARIVDHLVDDRHVSGGDRRFFIFITQPGQCEAGPARRAPPSAFLPQKLS